MKVLFVIDDLDYADHLAIAHLSSIAKQLNHQTFFCSLDKSDLTPLVEQLKPEIVAYSVNIIGFKKSFQECHRILKDGGYLILGQAIKSMDKNKDLLKKCGFELIKQLNWPEGCWWTDYYEPLEKKIKEISEKKEPSNLIESISTIESEIKMVKSNPKDFDCAHYILKNVSDFKNGYNKS